MARSYADELVLRKRQCIRYNPLYAIIFDGDINAALLYSQLEWWYEDDDCRPFKKTLNQLKFKTKLTDWKLREARRKIVERGLVKELKSDDGQYSITVFEVYPEKMNQLLMELPQEVVNNYVDKLSPPLWNPQGHPCGILKDTLEESSTLIIDQDTRVMIKREETVDNSQADQLAQARPSADAGAPEPLTAAKRVDKDDNPNPRWEPTPGWRKVPLNPPTEPNHPTHHAYIFPSEANETPPEGAFDKINVLRQALAGNFSELNAVRFGGNGISTDSAGNSFG